MMPQAWADCHSISEDIATLELWLNNIKAHEPGLLDWIEANAKEHILVLTNDYRIARNDFDNGLYFQAG